MSERPEPLFCDVCEKRIIRNKDIYREHWQQGNTFARHYDCEPYTVKMLLVEKRAHREATAT